MCNSVGPRELERDCGALETRLSHDQRGQMAISVNIPIPTKIDSKVGGAPTPKWDPIGFDPQPNVRVTQPLISLGCVQPRGKASLP